MNEASQSDASHNPLVIGAAWAAVGIPLLWGVILTLIKASQLFQ